MLQVIRNIRAWNKYTQTNVKNSEAINLLGYIVVFLPFAVLYRLTGTVEFLYLGLGLVEGSVVVTTVYSNKMGKLYLEGGEAAAWGSK